MTENAYDMLNNLEPAVKKRLESTEIYQQFWAKRNELEEAAHDEFERSGRLTSGRIHLLRNDVEALGTQVLDEVKSVQFMLSEPSFEGFQSIRNRRITE